MKKFLKILAAVVAVFFVGVIILIVLILKQLPSPSTIGQYLKPSNIKTTLKSIDKKNDKKELPEKLLVDATGKPAETKSDGTFSLEEDQVLIADLLDEKKPTSEVCAYLRNAPESHLAGYNFKDFGQRYRDSVLTENKDPLIQSIKPMLKFLFTKTAFKDVLLEAQAADASGDRDGLLDKASFYAKMVSAYRDIITNKEELENVMDRSYHLMIMGKVVAKNPDLLNDSRLNGYCQDIEKALNTDTPVSFAEERAEFNKFMEYSGVNPKEVGYDPNYHSRLEVTFTGSNLKMHGGWIDSLIKPSPEELKGLEEMAK